MKLTTFYCFSKVELINKGAERDRGGLKDREGVKRYLHGREMGEIAKENFFME